MSGAVSQSLFERGLKVLVEGVSSPSRGPAAFGTTPRYMSHGQGTRLVDVDGREYLDWMMAFGALPLGHAHPAIVEVVAREITRGSHFATALEVEVEVAEILVDLLPHVDKIRFANTGPCKCLRQGTVRAISGKPPLRGLSAALRPGSCV